MGLSPTLVGPLARRSKMASNIPKWAASARKQHYEHIGHAIISRSVFVGLREAVRQMKMLIREAATRAG